MASTMTSSSMSARCGGDSHSLTTIIRVLIFCFSCHLLPSTFARSLPRNGRPLQADATSRLLFVFGDSYADTGNTPSSSPSWHPPYGITWPGSPSGRFCNGFIQTDILAATLGVPSPTPYSRLSDGAPNPSDGINFAVAGSGVTYALGTPRLSIQATWFEGLATAGLFDPEDLKRAVFLISVVGNDYAAYNGSTLEGYIPLTHSVAYLIDQNLRVLYSLGARNFVVPSIAPITCLPSRTSKSGYVECERNATVNKVVALHNHLLGTRLMKITRDLEGSSVLYLPQTKAMMHVLENLAEFNLTEGLRPCVIGTNTTTGGIIACDNPEQHFFWDAMHPTQAGWRAVMSLYTNRTRSIGFSPSLRNWLKSLPT
ncbi:hypothetical protein R1flu_012579 [Riccia fluitans]|uniref:GDSL esterase/lipase n=1 Tax=Riccia fluitans TaxID=41844 RepID=A0ABD1ZED6_9MARC